MNLLKIWSNSRVTPFFVYKITIVFTKNILYFLFMNTFDRYLNKAIKILSVCIICIMLIIGFLFVTPVYVHADDVIFTDLPIANTADADFAFTVSSNSSYSFKVMLTGSVVEPNDFVCAPCFVDNSLYLLCNYSSSTNGLSDYQVKRFNNNSLNNSSSFVNLLHADTGLYYQANAGNLTLGTSTSFVPIYADLDSAMSAFSSFLGGSSSSVDTTGYPTDFDIPPGYVCYVYWGDTAGKLELTCEFNAKSALVRPHWPLSARYSYELVSPSSGMVFDDTFGQYINWLIPASVKKDIFGRSNTGGYVFDMSPDDSYIAIYNPISTIINVNSSTGGFNNTRSIPNQTIHCHGDYVVFAANYELTGQATIDQYHQGSLVSSSPDDFDKVLMTYGTPDNVNGDMEYQTTSTGVTGPAFSYPTSGDNSPVINENDDTFIGQINNTLNNLLSSILNFLSAPIEHISSLFNAGSSFMEWLSQLYTWLPAPVVAVVTDALIVLLVIGVIKFLWK